MHYENKIYEFKAGLIKMLMLLYIRFTAQKCYCEYRMGGGEKNKWLCGSKGESQPMWSCKLDEWCTGPFTWQTATANYQKLCVPGRILWFVQRLNNRLLILISQIICKVVALIR